MPDSNFSYFLIQKKIKKKKKEREERGPWGHGPRPRAIIATSSIGRAGPFCRGKEPILMRKEAEPHMNPFIDSLVWFSALSLTPSLSIISHHKKHLLEIEPIKKTKGMVGGRER